MSNTRARNERLRRFYNYGEGPYSGLLMVEAPTSAFTCKTLSTMLKGRLNTVSRHGAFNHEKA